jgi:hypothetical protein
VLDRSLALRFKSRRRLPRVRISLSFSGEFGARAVEARALFFPATQLRNALNFPGSPRPIWLGRTNQEIKKAT